MAHILRFTIKNLVATEYFGPRTNTFEVGSPLIMITNYNTVIANKLSLKVNIVFCIGGSK